MRRRGPIAMVLAGLLALPGSAAAQDFCPGTFPAPEGDQPQGPPLRFGVTPSGAAGQLGPVPSEFAPDQPRQIMSALERLRPAGAPFVTHVYSGLRNAGPDEEARVSELVGRYTGAGFQVELVLRFNREGATVAQYLDYVRRAVRLFAENPGVVAFQITNEVNFKASPDSSDGAFEGAVDALVQGVVAADAEARRLGYDQLEVGFNWVYRLDPGSEREFWTEIGEKGGPPFLAALDWVGLDAYPGTFFPPPDSVPPGGERDWIVNALSSMRDCYMPLAKIPGSVPIHVQENGFPTGPGRSYERQEQALETMVRAFHDFRGTYNVSDHRWFNMRDADTESPNFQQQYGLMTDAYVPKPAFHAYARLAAELGARGGGGRQPGPVGRRARGCLPRSMRVGSRRIGRLRLGQRRGAAVRAAGEPASEAPRVRRWCVEGGGRVVAALGRSGEARLIATTARAHRARIRRSSRLVVGRARRRVRWVAVADRRLIRRPALLRFYLRRAGLRR